MYTHAVLNDKFSFFFYGYINFHCICTQNYYVFFIQFFIQVLLKIKLLLYHCYVSNDVIKIEEWSICDLVFSFSSHKCQYSRYWIIWYFYFYFLKQTQSVFDNGCNNLYCFWQFTLFPFHIFAICCFLPFWFKALGRMWDSILLWLLYICSQLVVMFTIFSSHFGPYVCLFWESLVICFGHFLIGLLSILYDFTIYFGC